MFDDAGRWRRIERGKRKKYLIKGREQGRTIDWQEIKMHRDEKSLRTYFFPRVVQHGLDVLRVWFPRSLLPHRLTTNSCSPPDHLFSFTSSFCHFHAGLSLSSVRLVLFSFSCAISSFLWRQLLRCVFSLSTHVAWMKRRRARMFTLECNLSLSAFYLVIASLFDPLGVNVLTPWWGGGRWRAGNTFDEMGPLSLTTWVHFFMQSSSAIVFKKERHARSLPLHFTLLVTM